MPESRHSDQLQRFEAGFRGIAGQSRYVMSPAEAIPGDIGAGAAVAGAHGIGALAAVPGLAARLAMASPKLAGYGACGVGAAGRFGANAIDKLGPLGTLPYGSIARGTRQLGRMDQNPFDPPPQP